MVIVCRPQSHAPCNCRGYYAESAGDVSEDHLEELKAARDRVSDDDSEESWLGVDELSDELARKSQGVSGEELTALSS